MVKIRHNPYAPFASSPSPVGIYARKRWLGQELTPQWKVDFQRTAQNLFAEQSPDGCWEGSIVETVRHLFGLHLTVREPNQQIDRALDWLLERVLFMKGDHPLPAEELRGEGLHSLPFTAGSFALFAAGATLFLATVFGRTHEPGVLDRYEGVCRRILSAKDRPPGWLSANNVLRALAAHPVYSHHAATEKLVSWLSTVQEGSGRWVKPVPLFQTVNALAHLDSEAANRQVNQAFLYLAAKQHPDGTWGREQREWNTFLVVHALRSKGVL